MSIDVHPEAPQDRESQPALEPGPPSAERPPGGTAPALPSPSHSRRTISPARWWRRGLFSVGVLAIAGIAMALLGGSSSREDGPQYTHTITRGDLVVTIIEQGTLESSDNTEIKCKVRGWSTVIWVIDVGTEVEPGDVLVRLDTKAIDDAVSLQTTNAHLARATLERSLADVAQAELAISAYLEGTYQSQLLSLERELAIAESNLATAGKMYELSEMMFRRGYINELEVESNAFTVTQAELELEVKRTEIDVLTRFTREMRLETLNGNLIAARSKLEADQAGLAMDEGRLERAREELEQCVITSDRAGLVIYPSAAAWKDSPDITEGATVRKDQVLLLMPDLSQMQVKVGIHESIIDRVRPGLVALISLPDQTLTGEVASVASVTRPAGWWTGNVVKYDTIIQLPSVAGLKPGMSAEVELILAEHRDVLTIPVAAVIETAEGHFCWVRDASGTQRRSIQLGDSNDVFIVVESGLKEGDEVVLNPMAYIDEAKDEVLEPIDAQLPEQSPPPDFEAETGISSNEEAG